MEVRKKKLLELLDVIEKQQKEISMCHDYYYRLEKEFEKKREHMANPEDLSDLSRNIETLNREYEEKIDPMFEELNSALLKGHDLAEEIGNEIAHDFRQLWDYMTDSVRREVELERVLAEIDRIRKDFLA